MMETNSEKKIRPTTILYALLAIGLLALTAILIAAYVVPRTENEIKRIVEKFPYPIVIVGWQEAISIRSLAENMRSVRRFYEAQDFSKVGMRVDFSTDEGKKRFLVREREVLEKMIEDRAIMLLARERGIVVTREAASEGVRRKLEEYGSGDEVKQNLDRLYGWTLDDFEQKVVLPSLYEEKLREYLGEKEDTASQAKERILQAKEALEKKTAFEEVAKRHSDGRTADNGGDLGWFVINDLAPELRSPILSQKVGTPGDVVESSLGFHILLIDEVKKENGKQLYHLKQVFAKKKLFADWLSEEMRALSVLVLSPEFRWNESEARVEFRDENMRTFERELYEETSGDAAFFF